MGYFDLLGSIYYGPLWCLRMWGISAPFIPDPRLSDCSAETPLATNHSFDVTGGVSCIG